MPSQPRHKSKKPKSQSNARRDARQGLKQKIAISESKSKTRSKLKNGPKSQSESNLVQDTNQDKSERIAKRMARAGLCSRRDAERWIAEGRVRVNGEPLTTPAFKVSASDQIEVDGTIVGQKERTRLWLFHKPAGVLTANSDPQGRPILFDHLPEDLPRVVSVGRLDMNTEGLLLLTNDGGLSRILELPSTGWLRRYRVRAFGKLDETKLQSLTQGIAVDGVLYGAIEAMVERSQGQNHWMTLSLREGKNREIKNVLASIGLEVNRLIRISYGPFQLGDLAKGEVKEIRSRTLRDQLGRTLIEKAGLDFSTPPQNRSSAVKEKTTTQFKNAAGRRKSKFARGTIAPAAFEKLDTGGDSSRHRDKKFKKSNVGKSNPTRQTRISRPANVSDRADEGTARPTRKPQYRKNNRKEPKR